MSVIGIEQITYGINNLAQGQQFFSDWGLHCIEESSARVCFGNSKWCPSDFATGG